MQTAKFGRRAESSSSMNQKTNNKSGDGSGDSGDNKVLTLIDVFFMKTKSKSTLRKKIVRNIASFALVPSTFRLLLACKEMLVAERKIFQGLQLPTMCDMRRGDGLKMYNLMVRTPNSRWLMWLATSKAKTLLLPRSVTDEEMSIIFGGVGRFSELQTLNLSCCRNITDASLTRVARGCSNLQSLNVYECNNLTGASLAAVGALCSYLQSLDLRQCFSITSVDKNVLRKLHPKLRIRDD